MGYEYNAEAAAAALAAQRDRDELDAARAALAPDFATSCRLAASRKQNAAAFPREPVTLPPRVEADPDIAAHVTGGELLAQGKRLVRLIAKHEAKAIELQTFIGPRTPSSAARAETLRAWHQAQWELSKTTLRQMHPLISEYRATLKAEAIPAALEAFIDESEQATGMSVSAEEYAKQQNQRAKLKDMAAEICRRLETAGVETRRNDDCGLWVYWIHSKVWEQIDQYRRICINPLIAASSRAGMLASLEYYIQRNPFCRFWTFTTGQRCSAAEIPARLDKFFEKLRKLNYALRKDWGVEILMCSTEFGTVETDKTGERKRDREIDAANEEKAGRIEFDLVMDPKSGLHRRVPLFHPHFHCVIRSTIGLRSKGRWQKMCRFVRRRWGCNVHFGQGKNGESAVIQNAREIVKYVTKPGDLLKLTPAQLREFYEATSNRRLVRPLASLKKEIAERNARPVKVTLRRLRVAAGRYEWQERTDHNQTFADTVSSEDRAHMDELVDAEVWAAECAAAANASPGFVEVGETFTLWSNGSTDRASAGMERAEGLPVRLKDKPTFCQVVAFIPPAAGPTRRKENRVIVMGNVRDQKAVEQHQLVRELTARTWTSWAAGEALAGAEACFADELQAREACFGLLSDIYLDTGTVTVPGELQTPAGWRLDDPLSHATQMVFETA